MGETPAVGAGAETMRRGAIAMIDALGTKGIWADFKPQEVLAKFGSLANSTRARIARSEKMTPTEQKNWTWEVAFLSDTIAMAIAFQLPMASPDAEPDTEALRVLAWNVGALLREAVLGEGPAFVYRGVIAFGEYAMDPDRQFLVGPAVDEAGTLMEQVEGALVWLAPSARRVHESKPASGRMPPNLIPYSVPLKAGRAYKTLVVSPLSYCSLSKNPAEDRSNVQSRILKRMQDRRGRLDVEIKRDNTEAFLAAAMLWEEQREHASAK